MNTSPIAPSIYHENTNLSNQERTTKFINKNLDCTICTIAKTRNITDIPIDQQEYQLVLHFKNGGLITQLTCEQLKLLANFYRFTQQDIIALKDKPEFIEYLNKKRIKSFTSLPEIVKQDPIIAKTAFLAGEYAFIQYISKEEQTQEICDKAFKQSKSNFIYFNDEFKTLDMCKHYLENYYKIDFSLIPEKFRNSLQQTFINKIKTSVCTIIDGIELLPINILKENLDIIYHACLLNSDVLLKLHSSFITKELLTAIAKESIGGIPKQYLTLELVLLSIKYSGFHGDSKSSRDDKLKIVDEYFILHNAEIQEACWQRYYNADENNSAQFLLTYLLKYCAKYLSEQDCLDYLQEDVYIYKYLPNEYKSNIQITTFVLKHWLDRGNYKVHIKDIVLQYKNHPEKFIELIPSEFFTQEKHFTTIAKVEKKNDFLRYLPNEYKTIDIWIYHCININRSDITQIPEAMQNEELLMLLVDEYVQDDSRFDLEFTEILFAHKLFNLEMQQKIFIHSLKCSARCSNSFITILQSPSIPQTFKDDIFKNVMQGNVGYTQPDITELYAKTNPLQNQIPANFATQLLSSLYKLNGFSKLTSVELITELKTYMTNKTVYLLPLDTTETISSDAKITGGRTLQLQLTEDTAIFYKFRKPRESLADFTKEGYFLEFLAENHMGKQLQDKLKSEIPIFSKMVRIPVDNLPVHIFDCDDDVERYFDDNGIKCSDVLIFLAPIDYLQYAHKADVNNQQNSFTKPEQGMLTACHDLGVFISQGIYHTSTLPLFHYADRKWSVLNMILRGLSVDKIRGTHDSYYYLNQFIFSMTGKVEYWDTKGTERPDYGYTGLRDLADYEFYNEIASTTDREDSTALLFKTIKQKAYAANAICECFMAVIFLYARLHKFSADYHYTNDSCKQEAAGFIENMFTSFLAGMFQDKSINLQEFMQLTTEDYQQWLERTVTELLYWTAQQPEIENQNGKEQVATENNDCFACHVNQHELPKSLFDDTTVLPYIRYPKHFTITECGKRHNNLGMFNGTFPLLALTNFMILFTTKLNEYATSKKI